MRADLVRQVFSAWKKGIFVIIAVIWVVERFSFDVVSKILRIHKNQDVLEIRNAVFWDKRSNTSRVIALNEESIIVEMPVEKANITAIKAQGATAPFFSAQDPVDYCGETVENHTSNIGPNVADCQALKGIVDYEPGYWDVTANAGGSPYTLLISHGSCGVVVKPWNPSTDLLVGSQDVSDLLYDQYTNFPDNETYSAMTCAPGNTITTWAIVNINSE